MRIYYISFCYCPAIDDVNNKKIEQAVAVHSSLIWYYLYWLKEKVFLGNNNIFTHG